MIGRADRAVGRRGATMVLTALMTTMLIGFVALAVDTSVLAVARNQLGIASDAAALAGASALADERRLNPNANLDLIFNAARVRAREFAEQNQVLGTMPTVFENSSNDPSGDIVLGRIANPANPASPFQTDASLQSNYNSVQVRVARSAERGGIVPTFFAKVMGIHGSSVQVTGTASALNYSVAGYTSEPNKNADLLPFALDRTTYEEMIDPSIQTSDNYTINLSTRAVSNGPDGIKESVLFPTWKGPGNWGTVNIGVSNNSTNTLRDQILDGVTPQQLKTYAGGELTLNLTDAFGKKYVMLDGNPGISAGMKSALEEIIGQPRTLPIYEWASGNGNNMEYKIVDFAPVRVMAINFQGNPKYVIVQPAITRDPTAIPGELQTNWTAGGLIRLNLTR